MNYAAISLMFLLGGATCYGMEGELADLEKGTESSFASSIATLREMGLVRDGEGDVEKQIERLSEDQKNRLLAGQTTRSGVQSGGSFLSNLFGQHQHAHSHGEALFLLRELHRIALEQQEELEQSSRRLKYLLLLIGTGLLGSLGLNGGLLGGLFSGNGS